MIIVAPPSSLQRCYRRRATLSPVIRRTPSALRNRPHRHQRLSMAVATALFSPAGHGPARAARAAVLRTAVTGMPTALKRSRCARSGAPSENSGCRLPSRTVLAGGARRALARRSGCLRGQQNSSSHRW